MTTDRVEENMGSDVEKQIAFEMAKAIIEARNDVNVIGSSVAHYKGKIQEVSYWTEVYHLCLEQIKKKPNTAGLLD